MIENRILLMSIFSSYLSLFKTYLKAISHSLHLIVALFPRDKKKRKKYWSNYVETFVTWFLKRALINTSII